MATTSETSKILSAISELKSQIAALEAKMGSLALTPEPSAAKTAKAAKKPRDPEAPKRPKTEWILFTERVRSLLVANGYSGGAEVQQFCSHLKEEQDMYKWNDESILASRKLWTAPEKKPRAPKSVASVESDSEKKPKADKPKKVLSPEHLAKLAEGRARKAAEKKAAATAAAPAPEPEASSEPTSEAESTGSKKRGPKKGTKLTDEQKAARKAKMAENKLKKAAKVPLPADSDKEEGEVSEAEEEPEIQFNPLIIKGKRYWWNPLNHHCYHREEDGSKGDWAGLLNFQDKSITLMPAPAELDQEICPDCGVAGHCA